MDALNRNDENAELSIKVVIEKCVRGDKTIPAIKAVRHRTNSGLGGALNAINQCISGEPATVETINVENAKLLVAELQTNGFSAKQIID